MATSTDFTGLADLMMHKLGKEFQALHSKEEVDTLITRIEKAKNANDDMGRQTYGANVQKFYSDCLNLLEATLGDSAETLGLPEPPLTQGNEQAAFAKLRELSMRLKSREEIDSMFLEEVYNIFRDYKGGTDHIRRLVIRRLREISPEFVCQKDQNGGWVVDDKGRHALLPEIQSGETSTRLLILKQFIKQFGWCEGVWGDDAHGRGFECPRLRELIGGKSFDRFALEIDESIFDALAEKKDNKNQFIQRKKDNNLRLVNIAKNLGDDFFQRNFDNREMLYVFAIAFEMTWSGKAELPEKGTSEYETDLRKNLFFDFYTENLIDTLTEKDAEKAKRDITGYGINYKNFAEICYLREIALQGSALDKLREAREMIRKCIKSDEKKTAEDVLESLGIDADPDSRFYIRSFKAHLTDDSETFLAFVLKNYACTYDPEDLNERDSAKPYEYSAELRTADRVYAELTKEKVRDHINEANQVRGFRNKLTIRKSLSKEEQESRKSFNKLLDGFNELIKRERSILGYDSADNKGSATDLSAYKEGPEHKELRDAFGNKIILRSDILIAALNYRMVTFFDREDKLSESEDVLLDFEHFYDYLAKEYKLGIYTGLNAILLRCGFMELNPKDVFDLLAIYCAYQRAVTLLHANQAGVR